ncbi:MAG TPA: hypothetical protein VND54_13585 [Candidatus Saccharimonadales bacterium]|nr:hypothetical protein [Candidatus Saccharimonadales bacterium]
MALSPHVIGAGGFRRSLLALVTSGFRPVIVSVSVLIVAATASCSSPPPLAIDVSGAWTTRTIDHSGLSLSVPANWNVGEADVMAGSFTDLIGSFSNQSLSPPCTTGPNTIECGLPLTLLQPGAMLVVVWHNGSPQWTIDSQPGTPTTVSRLQARVTDQLGAHGLCSGLGADRTRTEVIAFPDAPDNYFEVDICSRGVADAVGTKVMGSVQVTPTA